MNFTLDDLGSGLGFKLTKDGSGIASPTIKPWPTAKVDNILAIEFVLLGNKFLCKIDHFGSLILT